MKKTVKLLRELIALPSVNPSFLPAGDPLAGEQKVADFLAATAARAGLDVEFQSAAEGRSNLLAVLSPRTRATHRVLLAPHMDTVNGTPNQFKPQTRDGKIHGRGACDTKGSVAAMLQAVCEIAKKGKRPATTEVVFAALIDEEQDQAGSRALVANNLTADLAIVGEPTRGKVVTAHKGSLWLQLETRGKAAHGSQPHLGRNAIHEMARVVHWLETAYAARLRDRQHALLGHATVSVGVIAGGSQPNIVPDRCVIRVDRRTLPGETEKGVMAEIAAELHRAGLQADIGSLKVCSCLPMETDPDLAWVRTFMRSAGQRRPVGMHYYCDAAVLAEGGIPSVVYGPGDIAQAHTTDEWVDIDSLEQTTRILTGFLRSLP